MGQSDNRVHHADGGRAGSYWRCGRAGGGARTKEEAGRAGGVRLEQATTKEVSDLDSEGGEVEDLECDELARQHVWDTKGEVEAD